jgi:hypothetical protein
VQVGAGLTTEASAKEASVVEVEPPKAEAAPAFGPEAEAATAEVSTVQPRKRGRPKKADGEEKTEAKPGKRQKSLFDF